MPFISRLRGPKLNSGSWNPTDLYLSWIPTHDGQLRCCANYSYLGEVVSWQLLEPDRRDGTEPWRKPVWGPEEVRLSHDPGDGRILVQSLPALQGCDHVAN